MGNILTNSIFDQLNDKNKDICKDILKIKTEKNKSSNKNISYHKNTKDTYNYSKSNAFRNRYRQDIRRGDIVLVDLGIGSGSEQSGIRPCLIVQNDVGNIHSTTTIVVVISSKLKELPTHLSITDNFADYGLNEPSQILFEQIRTIDKYRIISKKRWGYLDIEKVKPYLMVSLGFAI